LTLVGIGLWLCRAGSFAMQWLEASSFPNQVDLKMDVQHPAKVPRRQVTQIVDGGAVWKFQWGERPRASCSVEPVSRGLP
jgi:hypothetical protein